MSAFDPPPYLGKLISAINDGAKSAQLGAVAFVFIGLFLLATSFSATDEELLVGKSITISQYGIVTVPVVLSFGFMPAIFLALHLYTLIRFDLLMQNLRHFQAELRATVPLEKDRQSCLQLLANTEFIQAQLKPEASFVFRWTYRFMLAVFPVGVLLLVQLSSLRLQSHVVNVVHHIIILLAILLLIWFFRRQRPSGDSVLLWLFKRGRFVLPALVLGFDLAWCQVPSATATTVLARAQSFGEVLRQPVDELLCPLGLGCRYIAVPRQTMVAKVWDTGAFLELRAGAALDATRRAAFDPLILRNRRLRFADLSGSQFFNVDLTGAELQGARLDWAQLQGARFSEAQLQGASLYGAQMQGASFFGAQMQFASLDSAQLQGARLDSAQLQGARLSLAKLQGASLKSAKMQGASLTGAQLEGASLDRAQMQGASLVSAQLQGALIAAVWIWGLQARDSALADAEFGNLEFGDAPPCPIYVRADEPCPTPRSWLAWIEEWTKSVPAGHWRTSARQRLAVLTADKPPAGAETELGAWNSHPAPQPEAVAKRLGDLACGTPHAPHLARGIFRQILGDDHHNISTPRNLGAHRQTLAARMLSDDCAGAKGLSENERALLTYIANGRQ